MALTVTLSRRALADLASICTYLLEHSPQGADRVRAYIAATIDQLAAFPLTGPATDEPPVRVIQLTRYPYRIFHEVTDTEVVILHVRHVAQ